MNFRSLALTCMMCAVFLIAAFVSAENSIKNDTDPAISKHRMGSLQIKTKAGAQVTVSQIKHEFGFGAAISNFLGRESDDSADLAMYKKIFKENFNSAVTENALKWPQMEREQGKIDYSVVDNILAWCEENDIPLRGHNIFWGISGRVQQWQKDLTDEELLDVVKNRSKDIGKRYRGRFQEYDLNNEMLHGNYYEDRLGDKITLDMGSWVKSADPGAKLYLNDYDILTGNYLDRYAAQIEDFLANGVPIAGIGVQGHLHGDDFDPEMLKHCLDTLAKFNLPIKITEFNMPGQRSPRRKSKEPMTEADEQAKAENLVDYYRICFANPAVEGILMWGFWENANWIPFSSLWKADWSPTPAADAYRALVFEEWWTTWDGKAGSGGVVELRAFYGTYEITSGGETVTVEFLKNGGDKTVNVGL
jgi:endo-1,4-beta-xylanase